MDTCNIAHENASKQMRPLRPQSWWTICCREPFHGAATRSRDSLPMYHLAPTRVPSVRKQHCFISFAILFHMFPLVIYCLLLHQWNHRVTGYEFCNRVEPKLEPKPITTSTREGPSLYIPLDITDNATFNIKYLFSFHHIPNICICLVFFYCIS